MAVTFTGAGVASAASGASPQAVTTASALAVGDYLVALIAYDNSGGGGADPMSGTISVAPATGAVGASGSSQTGTNDPSTASSGIDTRTECFPVTTAIPSGTSVNVSWSGTLVVRAVALMKVSSSLGAGATVAYRTNSGVTGTNAAANPALTTPSVNVGEGLLCWAGCEYGAAVTGDADTTNGSWSAVYGTFTGTTTSGMAAYFQGKVQTTAASTQTWNPTNTTTDWVVGALIFTETVLPTISQTAYRIYAQGGEATSTTLAAENTAYSPDVSSGDVNLQLRTRLQETGTAAVGSYPSDFTLQYAKNAGAWTDVSTDPALLTTWPFSQYSNWLKTDVRSGQSFTGNGGLLSRMAFDIHKLGTPPGTYTAALYAHSGTLGTSSVGTGTALATSTTSILGTDISGVFGWIFFNFDETFTLVNGTNYVMSINATSAGDASNCVEMVVDFAAPGRPGNRCDYNGTTWTATATYDYMTQVYTKAVTPPTNVAGHMSAAMAGDTTAITEGQPTTQRLSNGTGSFVGAGSMTGISLCEGIGWNASNYVELLYGITLKSANLTNGDTLTFRVLRNNSTATLTYSVTPTLNIVKAAPTVPVVPVMYPRTPV